MAYVPVPNVVSIELRYFMQNNNAANILHAAYTGSIGISDLDDLAAVITAWLTTEWAPLVPPDWSANQIILTDLGSISGVRKSYPISPPTVGSAAGQSLAASSTLAVKADVGHRGKGVAGRVFWVGISEAAAIGNELDVTFCDDVVTALTALNTSITALAAYTGLCVPHRVINKVKQNPVPNDLVTYFLVTDNLIDVQKDRLPFHKKKRKKRTP